LFLCCHSSANYDADAGHKKFMQDIFMNESRIPGGNFGGSTIPWTNLQGDQVDDRDKTPIPEGWKWIDDWTIDMNRACDEEGKIYKPSFGRRVLNNLTFFFY